MEERQADTIWRTCFDCDVTLRLSDLPAHLARHRPGDHPFKVAEVARALGTHRQVVWRYIKTGVLKAFSTEYGHRQQWWIPREAFADYVKRLVASNPGIAMKWAAEGRIG